MNDDLDEPSDEAPPTEGSLAVGAALSGAATRLARPGGLLLVAAYLFVGFAGTVATTTLARQVLPAVREWVLANSAATAEELPPLDPSPFALSTTPETALAMVAVTALLAEAVNVVAVRTFVRDAASVPGAVVEGLAGRTVTSFLANVLAQMAVFAGLVAFVLPGVFLATAFYLVRPVVAVEGSGVLPALRRSWKLTAGHRLRVLLVLLVVLVVGQFAAVPGSLLGADGAAGTAGAVVGVLLGAVVTTFGTAVSARVYVRLAGRDAHDGPDRQSPHTPDTGRDAEAETEAADDEPLGALSPEEIDERFGEDERR